MGTGDRYTKRCHKRVEDWPGGLCAGDVCMLWNALTGECAERTVLVAIPPSLSELNTHLADLVELRKTLVRVVEASVPK